MKLNIKKILKWVGGIILSLVLLCVLGIYTIICFDQDEISRYSYCYFVCVSPELKGVPIVGLEGSVKYYSTSNLGEVIQVKPPKQSVRYLSTKNKDEIQAEISQYLYSVGFENTEIECFTTPDCKCCPGFKKRGLEIRVNIYPEETNDSNSAKTNGVFVEERFFERR